MAVQRGPGELSTVWLLATLILLLGAALRFWNVGRFGFSAEEITHVIAVRPAVSAGLSHPADVRHDVARAVVSLSWSIFGESEGTARFPFAAAGLAFAALTFVIVRRLFSDLSALIYLFAVSLSPLCVEVSRTVSPTVIDQFFYVTSVMSFLLGFEDLWSSASRPDAASVRMDVRWLSVSVICAAVADKVGGSLAPILPVMLAYSAIMIA